MQKVLRHRAKFPRCLRTGQISQRGRGSLQGKRLVLRLAAQAAGSGFRKFPRELAVNLHNSRQVLRTCDVSTVPTFSLSKPIVASARIVF